MKINFRSVVMTGTLTLAFAAIALGQDQAKTPAPPAASPAAGTTVPRLLSYSGTIKDRAGKPVTGPVSVTFSLYTEQENGTPLWTETQVVQADAQGHYTAFLGATEPAGLPLDVFTTGAARWLEVQASGAGELPRVLLVGVPYALKAADADTLGGKPLSAFVTTDSQQSASSTSTVAATSSTVTNRSASQSTNTPSATIGGTGVTNFIPLWTSSTTLGNSALFQSAGNIGLGTTAPQARLDVFSTGIGLKGSSSSITGIAVLGSATAGSGETFGVQGYSFSTSGIGVLGNAPAKSGRTAGVVGQVSSSTGTAGIFNNTAGGNLLTGLNNGILKFKVDGSGNVFGTEGTFTATAAGSNALTGKGATAVSGPGGIGVIGVGGNGSSSASGSNGGSGVSAVGGSAPNAISGAGVAAQGGTGAQGGPGVLAQGGIGNGSGDCCGGDGVDATGANAGTGVTATGGGLDAEGAAGVMAMGGQAGIGSGGPGVSATGGSGNAVGGDGIDAFAGPVGNGLAPNFAGSFTGDVTISGNLSVSGTKHFRIDHPLDPANKYLYHASIESSEVLNLYSGNVTLAADGTATVHLPDWFESLNKDFRYQLTAVGAPGPGLYIAQKMQGNSFKIAGGRAGMEVSWQVTGVRQDLWEKAHPMVVEAQKPQAERGYYINPELFHAPQERSVDWARNPQLMKRMKGIKEAQMRRAHAQPERH